MKRIQGKLLLAVAAIVVASAIMCVAVIYRASTTPNIVAGGLGVFLSVLSCAYIVQSVREAIQARERAAEQLRETANRLQTLIDAIPDAIYFKDTTGHHILVNKACEEAFGVFDAHGGEFDLLVTDVIMPRMCGQEIASRVLERKPAMKVLFMSGYPDNALVQDGILGDRINFLQKPFSANLLREKVRELVAQPARVP